MSAQPTSLARVPDMKGRDLNSAQKQAAAAGYPTSIALRAGPGRAGTVIDQRPEPGTYLAKRSSVVLAVTQGARQIGVPDVRGMPVDEARRVLEEADLTPGDVIYRRAANAEPNRVISTDPPGGATVDAGTTVNVVAAV